MGIRGREKAPLLFAIPIAIVAAALLIPIAGASAATIDVEIRTDEFANNGDCSLREAAQAANVDGVGQMEAGCTPGNGADVIDLDAGPAYALATTIDGTPDIDDGDLELTDPDGVTILGEGGATTIVDGGDEDRIFELTPGAGSLTLNAATVRNGLVAGGPSGAGILSAGGDVVLIAAGVIENLQVSATGDGGGIALLDEAALTASGDTVINDNIAAGSGGGIYKVDDGDITLNPGVNVDGNDAVGFGGGVFVSGDSTALNITGASVSNNDLFEEPAGFNRAWGSAINYSGTTGFFITDAQINGNDGVGDAAVAALEMFSSTASTIDSSTISGNTVTGQDDAGSDVLGPAAIRINANPGLTISDSSISQNTVTGADTEDGARGGGIHAIAGPLTITGSTFASNSLAGVGSFLGGGALYIESGAPTGILNSTFTANNAPSAGGAINLQVGGGLTIVQSTFSGNVSPQGPALNVQNNPATTLTLRGSIFDDGAAACQLIHGGVGTTVTADSFNVDAGTTCVDAADDSDIEMTDAQLGMLADNGGPTETMRLGGPAGLFNAAGICKQLNGTSNLLVDQRGFPRPAEGGCEPGAYERFICDGTELMQPGPFPGCPTPVVPQPPAQPLTPTTVDSCPELKQTLKRKLKRAKKRLRAARKADRPIKKKRAKVRKLKKRLAVLGC